MKNLNRFILICILILFTSNSIQAGVFTIPEWTQKSCVFIMKGDKPEGTGFLVWLKDQEKTFCYLVTAKHVAQAVLSDSKVPLSIRFNLKEEGKSEVITFPTFIFNGGRWSQHDNPSVDMAVIPLTIFNRIKDLDVGIIVVDSPTHEYFATSKWIEQYKVAPGDQVFTLGLVPYLFSNERPNLVLSRFGNISALPKDEISIPGGKQRAYFIDCPAFGGNSGGPVFVLLERSETGAFTVGWRFALLGIVTEFVPSPLRGKKVDIQDTSKEKGLELIENTGISKVVPVDYLIDILFSDEQKNFRKTIALKNKEN